MSKTLLDHFLLNPLMCLLHYTLHTHTHTPDYTNLRNMHIHNNEWPDLYQTTLYTDCLITLISYMHTQHYACYQKTL